MARECAKRDSRPEEATNEPVGKFPSERRRSRYDSVSDSEVSITVDQYGKLCSLSMASRVRPGSRSKLKEGDKIIFVVTTL